MSAVPKLPDLVFHIPPRSSVEHVHETDHMSFWQIRGGTSIRCGKTIVRLDAGEAVWLPAGTPHLLEVDANSVVFPLVFPQGDVATHLNGITTVSIREEEKIYLLALYQDQSTRIGKSRNLVRQVLSILERNASDIHDPPLPKHPIAEAVAQALLFNPGDQRKTAEWAAEVHTSSRTLERLFTLETGLTLGHWRKQVRMNAAAGLLASGASVTSVTHRVGYQSSTSFARVFRECFGVSPTEFAGRAQ